MSWHVIEISESCILGGAYHRFCRAFQHAFIAAGAPSDMALLARRTGLDETRQVYVSPASLPYLGSLLEEYEGRPCECPYSDDVTLVYGVPGVKARLLNTHEPARDLLPVVRQEAAAIFPLVSTRQAAAGA